MTIKFKKSDLLLKGSRARENKEFDQIVRIPDASDRDASQEFINITDVRCNTATLTELTDALDGDGQLVLEANYCLDMESAIRANIRKLKFEIYIDDPTPQTLPPSGYRPGTREYINERMRRALAFDSAASASSSLTPSAIRASRVLDAGSALRSFTRGLVKSFEVNTDVSDQMVQLLRSTEGASLSMPRKTVSNVPVMQKVGDQFSQVSQAYSVIATTDVKITSADALSLIRQEKVKGITNLIDSRLINGSSADANGTVQDLSRKILLRAVDPMSHVNMFYASGPTASEGSPGQPIKYSSTLDGMNEIKVSYRGRETDNRFTSVLPPNAQALSMQRSPDFKGDSDLETLYKKSAIISSTPANRSLFLQESIRKLTFASTLKQFSAEFDLSLVSVRPKVNRYLWVKVDLMDKDGTSYKSRTFKIDIKKQLKGLLTPALAPIVRITGQKEGKIDLEVEQRDLLATDITLYRMILRPENLSESSWTRIVDLKANTRRGTTRYTDTSISSNIDPNLVVYEARCSGLFGSVCPNTARVIKKGVKRTTGLAKSRLRGACNIVAIQLGNSIQIRVSRIPAGVTRIFLKKQIVNSALKERDIRKQSTVRALGADRDYHDALGTSGVFVFEDSDTINRQLYRYTAQFDWLDSERTTSVTEEFIEFRTPPDRPIASRLVNVRTDIDPYGRAIVAFDLEASFVDTGLDQLNKVLGSTGISSLFVDELRKDRSLVSNSLLFQVTRRNTRTNESLVWPLVEKGRFIDDQNSRLQARTVPGISADVGIGLGNEYVYTARLHIVNPERFFKEALTRIPASTRQSILGEDPQFIKVSAAKFAENFAIQPGTIQSPTTLEKNVGFSNEVQGAYTGISHSVIVDVPIINAVPTSVSTHHSVSGRPANVIRWTVDGSIETVYAFQVDITIGNDRTFPLMSISPSVSEDSQYEIRDEMFVSEIVPITYTVTAVYSDMSRSASIKSSEIYTKSTLPVSILDQAIKKLVVRSAESDLGSTFTGEYTIDRSIDSLAAGPLGASGEFDSSALDRIRAIRNSLSDLETERTLIDSNPGRRSRGI
jgi:hypothetical protein